MIIRTGFARANSASNVPAGSTRNREEGAEQAQATQVYADYAGVLGQDDKFENLTVRQIL